MEIEAKFSIPDAETFQRLRTAGQFGDEFALSPAQVRVLRDTYLDTADGRILAAGFGFRQRERADSVLLTLKGLQKTEGAIHRREEIQALVETPRPPAEWPPGPLRERVLQWIKDAPLVPLFTVQQTRTLRLVHRADRPVAELCLDEVRVIAGEQEQTYLELEAELTPNGSEEDLAALTALLQEEWGLKPERQSKFERGLTLLVGLPPSATPLPGGPGIEPDDSMAEAGRKTLLFHFLQMVANEPGTRLGADIEALHDMRVATRRMRAAFRVFDNYLDMQEMAPFLKNLRRTGRALGTVRDLDVFWAKTDIYMGGLPPQERRTLDPLQEAWQARREQARAQMLAHLGSDAYARFKERFGLFLQTPGAGALAALSPDGEPLPHRVRHVVPAAVFRRLAAVRAYDEWVTQPDVPVERLHQLRIAAKRLRYALEFFREVLTTESETLIKELKALQDHLGDLQDAVVASDLVRGFLDQGTLGPPAKGQVPPGPVDAPGVAGYLAAREAEARRLLDTFDQAWLRIQNADFGHQTMAALSEL
jgi:CHAD domain-containing protein